jgi:hypothetical protein
LRGERLFSMDRGFTVQRAHKAVILLEGTSIATIRNNLTTGVGHDGIESINSPNNVVEYNLPQNTPSFPLR